MMLGIAAVVALLLGAPPTALAQTPSAKIKAAALDRTLERAAGKSRTPGASAALVEDGALVWSHATGRREVDRRSRLRTTDLFPIASTTKTVSAILAMRLVEEGRLNLDETVGDELPGLPRSSRITVRMLLEHSSGLSDYFEDEAFDKIVANDPQHEWDRAEVLSFVRRSKFAPGSRHSYSNTNYIALGAMLEARGAGGVEQQFQSVIAEPLGLPDSTFAYDGALLPRLAHPHSGGKRRPLRDRLGRGDEIGTDYWGPVWTDGGLVSSAPELALIGNALFDARLLGGDTVESMLPPRRSGWGLGVFDIARDGRRWFGHDGLYGGYASENWTDLERGLTLVVLTNAHGYRRGQPASSAIWRRLAAIIQG